MALKSLAWRLFGLWLIGYPIAAILLIFGLRFDWFDGHPYFGLASLACWIGPLVATGWIDHRARKRRENDPQTP
jgi:hypothetical protein